MRRDNALLREAEQAELREAEQAERNGQRHIKWCRKWRIAKGDYPESACFGTFCKLWRGSYE